MRKLCQGVAFAILGVITRGQDPAVDDFERLHLGSNWTRHGGSLADIVNQSDLGLPTTTFCAAGWTASVFSADQFCEVRISLQTVPNMLFQVNVRRRTSDLARYGFHWNGPALQRWELKYDGVPTAQTRLLATAIGPGPQPGDTLRIEVEGTNPVRFRCFHNGQILLIGTDSAPDRITTTGAPGVVGKMAAGFINVPPTPIFEDWTGGSLRRPVISSLSPTSIPILPAGSAPLTITVNGARFVTGAEIFADGVPLATGFVSSTVLTCTLGPTLPATARPGGICLNIRVPTGEVSDSSALAVGGGSNQGTIRRTPLAPALGQPYALVLEGGTPSTLFSLYADLASPSPLVSWPTAAAGFVLSVEPAGLGTTFFPLVEGIGIFGPATAAAFRVDGSFELGGFVLPAMPAGISAALQAVFLDPQAALGFRLTWPRWPETL